MKVEIKDEKKNPLMKREEAVLVLDHSGKATPSRKEIWEAASKALKKDKNLIIVDSIFSEAGMSKSNARIFVYAKKEDIPEYKLRKMTDKKKEKKEEKSPEAPKKEAKEDKTEDKPTEETKEDKSVEAKEEPEKEEKPAEKKD